MRQQKPVFQNAQTSIKPCFTLFDAFWSNPRFFLGRVAHNSSSELLLIVEASRVTVRLKICIPAGFNEHPCLGRHTTIEVTTPFSSYARGAETTSR